MALRVRRTRRQTPGTFKLRKPEWIDPYPNIEGTEPEKRVFAMLVSMGIYFIYQGQVPEFEKGGAYWQLAPPNYKPDFVLPEFRLIIDPFSPFHHSLEEAAMRDQSKVVAYAVAGYAYYHPWAMGPGEWTWDQYESSQTKTVELTPTTRYAAQYETVYEKGGKFYKPGAQTTGGQLVAAGYKKKRVIKGYKTTQHRNIVSMYAGVNAARNKYRRIDRRLRGSTMLGTYEMIRSIPEIVRGPMYKLTDPRDIKAKRYPGYRVGQYVGAGANSVAAANKARATGKALTVRYGTRRTIRRS